MAFIEKDQVEVVAGQFLQPAVCLALKLLDVRDDYLRLIQIGAVYRRAADLDGLGIWCTREHLALLIKHVLVAGVEVGSELPRNRHARRNHQSAC